MRQGFFFVDLPKSCGPVDDRSLTPGQKISPQVLNWLCKGELRSPAKCIRQSLHLRALQIQPSQSQSCASLDCRQLLPVWILRFLGCSRTCRHSLWRKTVNPDEGNPDGETMFHHQRLAFHDQFRAKIDLLDQRRIVRWRL